MKDDVIELQGTILESLPNFIFKVKLMKSGHEILSTPSSKLKLSFIRILPCDKVTAEISPYNLTKGVITYRYK